METPAADPLRSERQEVQGPRRGHARDWPDAGRAKRARGQPAAGRRQGADRGELVDAQTGYRLWGGEYEGDASDLFALQNRVAVEIVGALAVELARPMPGNLCPAAAPTPRPTTCICARQRWAGRQVPELRLALIEMRDAVGPVPALPPHLVLPPVRGTTYGVDAWRFRLTFQLGEGSLAPRPQGNRVRLGHAAATLP